MIEHNLLKDSAGAVYPNNNFTAENVKISKSYVFNPDSRYVVINDLDYEVCLFILNTTKNYVIYNPFSPKTSGTLVNNEVNLVAGTTDMKSTDNLLIYYQSKNQDTNKDLLGAINCISSQLEEISFTLKSIAEQ